MVMKFKNVNIFDKFCDIFDLSSAHTSCLEEMVKIELLTDYVGEKRASEIIFFSVNDS